MLSDGFVSEEARQKAAEEGEQRARALRKTKARKAANARHRSTEPFRKKADALVDRELKKNPNMNLSQVWKQIVMEYEAFVEQYCVAQPQEL